MRLVLSITSSIGPNLILGMNQKFLMLSLINHSHFALKGMEISLPYGLKGSGNQLNSNKKS